MNYIWSYFHLIAIVVLISFDLLCWMKSSSSIWIGSDASKHCELNTCEAWTFDVHQSSIIWRNCKAILWNFSSMKRWHEGQLNHYIYWWVVQWTFYAHRSYVRSIFNGHLAKWNSQINQSASWISSERDHFDNSSHRSLNVFFATDIPDNRPSFIEY